MINFKIQEILNRKEIVEEDVEMKLQVRDDEVNLKLQKSFNIYSLIEEKNNIDFKNISTNILFQDVKLTEDPPNKQVKNVYMLSNFFKKNKILYY